MDELQSRLVQVGLERLAEHGFVLAGGQALQAHGLVERWSEDVDLFTDRWDPTEFTTALEVVTDTYRRAGLEVAVTRRGKTFARIEASDPATGQSSTVDLGADFRGHQPVGMELGPVLSEADAVGAKVAAVFSRAAARDYIDLAGILVSGRYDRDQLMMLAAGVDAGFTRQRFAEALVAVDRFRDEEFTLYGVDRQDIEAVRQAMRGWGDDLLQELQPDRRPTGAPRRGGPSSGEMGPGMPRRSVEGPGIGF